MKVKFIRFAQNVKIPERKNFSDTGADIFMHIGGVLPPMSTHVIPLGFGIEVPNGYTAFLQVRTSIAKQGITIEQCAIDAGYSGEIHMIITNRSNNNFEWKENDRLGYIIVHSIVYPEFVEDLKSNRGSGAFGSTGR